MVDRDVVVAKLASLDHALKRIAEARDPDRRLRREDAEDNVVFNLQRAAQAAIDVAAHVVAAESLGLPDRVADNFTLLERVEIIDAELAARLRRMAGFRNLAVHDYEAIDPEIVDAIVRHRLDDLIELGRRIASRFELDR